MNEKPPYLHESWWVNGKSEFKFPKVKIPMPWKLRRKLYRWSALGPDEVMTLFFVFMALSYGILALIIHEYHRLNA